MQEQLERQYAVASEGRVAHRTYATETQALHKRIQQLEAEKAACEDDFRKQIEKLTAAKTACEEKLAVARVTLCEQDSHSDPGSSTATFFS